MALSYGPARALAYDRRGFLFVPALTAMITTGGFFVMRCNAHKRTQALRTITLNGVNTVVAPRQEHNKSRQN
jgi:hypothetical protein